MNTLPEALSVVWSTQVLVPLLLAVAVVLTYLRYTGRRLFFQPWANLSGKDELDLGSSLSEVLFGELQNIRRIHDEAHSTPGLWNDKSQLPYLQGGPEASASLLSQIQLVSDSRFSRLLQFLFFFAPPASLRGTIHKFGDTIRLQVSLQGLRPKWYRPLKVAPTRVWVHPETDANVREGEKRKESTTLEGLLGIVSRLAHQIFIELASIRGFKSAEAFQSFTQGLQQHLLYDALRRKEHLEAAIERYDATMKTERGHAPSAYNSGRILYSQYRYDENERAIEYFEKARSTADLALQAEAYAGLAGAYCQKWQRFKDRGQEGDGVDDVPPENAAAVVVGDDPTVRDALRAARFAYGIVTAEPKSWLARYLRPGTSQHRTELRDPAAIVKAYAYALQVRGEQQFDDRETKRLDLRGALDQAIKHYEQATQLNRRFTVAYNNLGYLYLTCAENEDDDTEQQALLDLAWDRCQDAVRSNQTYHHAYDNLGNIAVMRAKLAESDPEEFQRQLAVAEEYYHRAIAYEPAYTAALQDLTKLHLRYAASHARRHELSERRYHGSQAWRYHAATLESEDTEEQRAHRCKNLSETMKRLELTDIVFGYSKDTGICRDLNCRCLDAHGNGLQLS